MRVKLVEHTIAERYDRSKGQIDEIIRLIDLINEKTTLDITLDNTVANHYTLTLKGKSYEFTLYKDILGALNLILSVIE